MRINNLERGLDVPSKYDLVVARVTIVGPEMKKLERSILEVEP